MVRVTGNFTSEAPLSPVVADAIAAALAEAAAEPATDAAASDSGGQDAPQGPPMTSGERDALRVAVKQCCNVGSVSSEARRTTVTVRVVTQAGAVHLEVEDNGPGLSASQIAQARRRRRGRRAGASRCAQRQGAGQSAPRAVQNQSRSG